MIRLKRKKKYIFLLLVSIFTVMTAGKVSATEKAPSGDTSVTNDSLTNAEQEKKELESALEEAQGLISDLQNSKEDAETKIQELDTKMSAIFRFFKIAPSPADASILFPRAVNEKEKRPQISEGVHYSICGVERCIMRPCLGFRFFRVA